MPTTASPPSSHDNTLAQRLSLPDRVALNEALVQGCINAATPELFEGLTQDQFMKIIPVMLNLTKSIRDDEKLIREAAPSTRQESLPDRRTRVAESFIKRLSALDPSDYDPAKIDQEADQKAPPFMPANDNDPLGGNR